MSRKSAKQGRSGMKKSNRKKENLDSQYREIFPGGYRYVLPEYEDLSQQYAPVASENYTTYSTGDMPIPAPLAWRRA